MYGLIGEHLSHSYSCEIHALLADYEYKLIELRPDELGAFLENRSFNAVNVTIPYKQAVIPYLDEVSDKAREIGAVNTIVNRGGRLCGYNTDYAGMRALADRIGIQAKGKKALILGTGGTAHTAKAVLRDMGAGEILTVSRSGRGGISYEEALERHSNAEIIFNTTPVGMYPEMSGEAIDISRFTRLEGVLDVVYNPLRTDLVLHARRLKIPAEGGLYMLAAQAVYASALFLGAEAENENIGRAYSYVNRSKQNVVLIGMPSSGKSSVGRLLAALLPKHFADTDELIIKKTGMPIADYFAKYGEASFRALERETVRELSKQSGLVIATGGGLPMDEENVRELKKNGLVVFLDRDVGRLIVTADRPLSSDRDALIGLYEQRYDKYRAAADIIVDGNDTVSAAADAVYREIMK